MVRYTTSKPARPAGSAERGVQPVQAQCDRIAQRAYELYEQRGRQDGMALENWLEAERELAGASGQA